RIRCSSSAMVVLPLPATPISSSTVLPTCLAASSSADEVSMSVRSGDFMGKRGLAVGQRRDLPQQENVGEYADEQNHAGDKECATEGSGQAYNVAGGNRCDAAHQIVKEIHDAADRACAAFRCD